ncbi:hypothetical protein BC835DRAFT_1314637 [Cytidiella melzeri]|nr:hypothetical protein BC835DRAFT_1314637 [Cytidiella melzeri]
MASPTPYTTPYTTTDDPATKPSAQPTTSSLPKIIPPPEAKNPRTLVLCFDGTGDQFDADNSNVIQFFTLLQKYDHTQQMVYYQAGIGTYTVPQIATPWWSQFSKAVDAAIAWNLDAHVMDGYIFLMRNYQAGDKICIFGFSRGAYTARSLAGMIHKVGLLPADNHQQVPFAYKMYTRCDDQGWEQSVAFKKAFSINVDIEFMGVWDTVCSVGLIPKRLPFVSSNTAIRYFRHAVSLDERRAKFKANLYNRPSKVDSMRGVQPGEMPTPTPSSPVNGKSGIFDFMRWSDGDKTLTSNKVMKAASKSKPKQQPKKQASVDSDSDENDVAHEILYIDADGDGYDDEGRGAIPAVKPKLPDTDVLEVWFAGCHCDVGGGSVKNGTRHNLARIPLRWMIRQCFLANTGIRFHKSLLRNVGLDPASLYPIVKPRPSALYVSTLQTNSPPSLPKPFVTELATSDIHTSIPPSDADVPPAPVSATPLVANPSTMTAQTLINHADTKLSVSAMLKTLADEPRVLTEEEEDLADALCPIYDQLDVAPGWWSLEVVPLPQRYQKLNDEWEDTWTINRGRGRDVPTPILPERFYVHRSVDIRMQATGFVQDRKGGVAKAYVPKARYQATPFWVE